MPDTTTAYGQRDYIKRYERATEEFNKLSEFIYLGMWMRGQIAYDPAIMDAIVNLNNLLAAKHAASE